MGKPLWFKPLWFKRRLLMASVSTGLVSGLVLAGPAAAAQDEETNVQNLPPVEVTAPPPSAVRRSAPPRPVARIGAPASASPRTRLYVYPTSPGTGRGLDVDKVPSAINAVDASQIRRTASPDIAIALQQYVPGLSINEVTGNPFQPDVQFRGFVASPLAGTPQGLAVYQNGVRINEAFSDTVNWDLIPTAAIRSAVVVTNNPAYGLNALGGAIDLQMKNGFNYQGAEIDIMGGSFGRIQGSAQWGKQVDKNWSVYGALEGVHDNGFRNFSQSDVRRFYGDVGYRFEGNEFHLNGGVANNSLAGPSTVPAELLQQYWGATYTTPQTVSNKVGYLNLTGKVEATPTWTFEGTAHLRSFKQSTVDGNPTDAQPCVDPTLLCFGSDTVPAFGLNGVQLANTFAPDAILGEIDRTSTKSTTFGVSGQATNSDQLFGHENRFVVGASYDVSSTRFTGSAELGTIGTNYVVTGSGVFLGASGDPTSVGPVSLRTVNQYQGLYALDTFNVDDRFAVTAGGRFNAARVTLMDQLGTALNGDHTYDRFNPIIGGTYKITSEVTAYAGYSEANRVPTPLELGCADPTRPCIIGQFLIADPPLQQVVSKTFEAGFRGTKELNIGSLGWKIGAYRATNYDDILATPIPGLTGFGFFQNVGRTRRQGVEAEVSLKSNVLQFQASYAFLDARFLDALTLGSESPFADADGNIQVLPGNHIPRLPSHLIKASIEYAVTDVWKVGGDALFVSSQYFVGDESNQFPKLPSYTVFNLHTSYQVTKNLQLYGRVANIFDNRYSTLGTFFDREALPNFTNGGAEFNDPRSLSPARPRAFYAGMRMTF
ncbi:outer membrane receptor protein involved in Fe transport [Bradyrhizobium japonicum]|uniref:TonB-dependent receptor n=1 Tax=Bradyrhizobium TaxID=374 RepID=UPI0004297A92|nr:MULTISPECIES: TonB-dependent receptor [Bradyrhizobium]MBR0881347.1 TonB-dependent receptor [Bradyrhizobium liaoningense]MBR0942576.1 TonB-dependent receptor [Bradyrhizobium liaoningense]MBR1030532.1 TonB-dependent receptor [Bradyrhizobium liaoningense]MBR1067608.1 TonB-dependent receptor [Bradyrhizobium liaoningense]MDI2072140.1 TonB-dependent receptor [Bradyrhizobium sp. Mp27]